VHRIILCVLLLQGTVSDSAISNEEGSTVPERPTDNHTVSSSSGTNSDEVPKTNGEATTTAASDSAPKVRMITKEELELHDGKQMDTMWVSVMSQVFDVTAGPEYYSENAPYQVFVARDGNVPFLTGVFTPEEAAKPITALDDGQLGGLEEWVNFYQNEDKYPFVGYLVGELYDENGKPTDMYKDLEEKLEALRIKKAERRRETQKLVEKRAKDDEKRKRQEAAKKAASAPGRRLLSFVSSLFQRGNNNKKEL
jgi:Cytochrome b5-like Heme/Steroid binding domain